MEGRSESGPGPDHSTSGPGPNYLGLGPLFLNLDPDLGPQGPGPTPGQSIFRADIFKSAGVVFPDVTVTHSYLTYRGSCVYS